MAGKDSGIDITLTADSTSVEVALQKLASGLDKTVDKLNKLAQASEKATKATASGLEQAGSWALKFVASITGIGSAIGGIMAIANQIKREYENLLTKQKGAADTQIAFETQLAEAVRNAAGLMTGNEIRQKTLEIAGQVNADQSSVAAALSSTLSAVGPTNKAEAEQAFEATRAAMQFAPEMGGADISALAGTAVDIAKRTGATPAQAIGFMQNIGGVARVPSLQNLSGNVAPAVMSVSQFGGSMQESGALVSALTQGMADTEGRISGTAAIGLAEQLRERLPKLGTTAERIAAIQNDPALFKAFFKGGRFGGKKFEPATFEKKAIASVEQLLSPGTMMARAFSEGGEKIGDVQGAGQKTYDDLMREVQSVTPASNTKRQFGTVTTEQQILDIVGGQTSITREGLKKYLESIGATALEQDVSTAIFEGKTMRGAMPTEAAASSLRNRAKALRTPVSGGGGLGGDVGFESPGFTPSNADLELSQKIDKFANALDQLAKETRESVKALKENTDATRQNNRENPPPAPRPTQVPSSALGRTN